MRKKLVSTLAFLHFDYSSIALGELLKGQEDILQKLQNSCVRYVTGARMRDHISPSRFRLGCISTYNRRLLMALSLIYKVLKTGQPEYLKSKITYFSRPAGLRPISREFAVPVASSPFY